jgi:glycine cleavage system H protein
MSGEITDVNPVLRDHPESINKDPHTTWIVKVRLSSPAEVGSLLDTEAYERLIA